MTLGWTQTLPCVMSGTCSIPRSSLAQAQISTLTEVGKVQHMQNASVPAEQLEPGSSPVADHALESEVCVCVRACVRACVRRCSGGRASGCVGARCVHMVLVRKRSCSHVSVACMADKAISSTKRCAFARCTSEVKSRHAYHKFCPVGALLHMMGGHFSVLERAGMHPRPRRQLGKGGGCRSRAFV